MHVGLKSFSKDYISHVTFIHVSLLYQILHFSYPIFNNVWDINSFLSKHIFLIHTLLQNIFYFILHSICILPNIEWKGSNLLCFNQMHQNVVYKYELHEFKPMLFFQSSIFIKILSNFEKQLVYISYEKRTIDKKTNVHKPILSILNMKKDFKKASSICIKFWSLKLYN